MLALLRNVDLDVSETMRGLCEFVKIEGSGNERFRALEEKRDDILVYS